MSDEKRPPEFIDDDQPDGKADGEYSASAIFLAMMRQAAERRQSDQPESEPKQSNTTPDKKPKPYSLEELEQAINPAAPVQQPEPEPEPVPEPETLSPPQPAAIEDLPVDKQVIGEDDLRQITGEQDPPHPPTVTPAEPAEPVAADPVVQQRKERRADIEAQRIKRVKRRREIQRQRNVGILGGFFRTLLVSLAAAMMASTIFTWFTSPEFFQKDVVSGLQAAQVAQRITPTAEPTSQPTPNYLRRIGIVSGHRGPENDPGAVCPDGLTEAEINFNVAQLTVRYLREEGYSVDLLDEFDARLDDYKVAALVSIHANTCEDYGEPVSGYLVARAAVRPSGGLDDLLAECLATYYGPMTGLERRFSLTRDMTDYHTFREIHPLTPAAIIELGFMRDDRELLTEQQDLLARAIVEGVRCFLEPEREQNRNGGVTPEVTTPVEITAEPTPQ